jgi:hypothetical protein
MHSTTLFDHTISSIHHITHLVPVVPTSPARRTDWFLALYTTHFRLITISLLLLRGQFSSFLLPITHSAILSTLHLLPTLCLETASIYSALVCPQSSPTCVLNLNLLLLPLMLDTSRQSMQAEIAFLTVTRYKVSLSHPSWSGTATIPLKSYGKIQQSKTQINLKLAPATILIVVLPFPAFWTDITLCQIAHNDILTVDYTV